MHAQLRELLRLLLQLLLTRLTKLVDLALHVFDVRDLLVLGLRDRCGIEEAAGVIQLDLRDRRQLLQGLAELVRMGSPLRSMNLRCRAASKE